MVSGFEYETEKVFQTGVRMKTTVFQPPDPGSVKFWLQSRMPDTYREKKQQEVTGDDAFLQFLDNLDERAKRERAVNVIDIKPDAIDVD